MEKPESKIKNWHKIALLIIAISFVGVKLWQLYWPKAVVELSRQKIDVWVSNSYYHLHKGLGGRSALDQNQGMLFVFGEYKRQGMVMRGMKFPIDIIWLNNNLVVDFVQKVPIEPGVKDEHLKVYFPRGDSNLVLELGAGWIEQNGLKIGDKLTIISN